MPLSVSLFPDIDNLDDLIESSMPILTLLLITLAVVLAVVIASKAADRRSPVDRLVRHARRSFSEGGRRA